jgi:hypothetical protein
VYLLFCFVQATEIQAGMDIFSIPQPPYKELAFLEHELELLSRMWGAVADWEATYGGWKNGHFKELKVCDFKLDMLDVLPHELGERCPTQVH